MTEDVTPLMSPTMNLSKKRNVKRTSERVVSSIMRRLPSMRLLRSAESPLLRIVIFPEMKFAPLNMSLSAGPSKKSMMLRMMLLNAQLFRMRSLLCREEGCQEVHSHHWMYQGAQRGVCPCWLWIQEGAEVCYDKTSTIVQDAPKEECNLEPQRTCADVTKEVCTRSRTNPRKVKKPVVKKWCYVPTEES